MSTADSSDLRVFISYSHDSPEHQQRVLDLSDRLRSDGIDAWIDQYTPWPEQGWPRWMEAQMRYARFVLMVCTETYLRRVTGQEEPGAGRGVCWEANLVYNDLYQAKISTSKYIPIVFSAADAQHIPPVLQGRTHFCLDSDEGYWQLYRLLTDQPEVEAGKLGFRKQLPRLKPLGPTAQNPLPDGAAQERSKPAARSNPAAQIWREKLAFLQEQEALLSDPAQRFAVRKQIEEAERKIDELDD